MDEFWVFGYGSLMWNPGFPYEERSLGRAFGYHRSLCVRSWVHRGTQENPGLVLGLDRGGSCKGVAFKVASDHWPETLDYLRERELVTNVYLERQVPVQLADRRSVSAVTYVVDRRHVQYSGAITPAEAARVVGSAVGRSGPNIAYLTNTVAHLREAGIRDHWLEKVESLIPVADRSA
ncbi:gamma-glutamylcyclotransferase [Rhizobium halophytocola]|uniref:glutathione-specific gamma-glutamylcyclotransferase n=1 Tax=Rhizobium halophytocola TaxID=735519 RepID=A0ABS4E2M0_9HYPH|nr:gamma-glutamylcyclotransferase [Rhizobium halophytocola]MBP1852178.1 cation transport protein ChaC [Rhizobium halophytocola]